MKNGMGIYINGSIIKVERGSVYLVVFLFVLSRLALFPLQSIFHQLDAFQLNLEDVEAGQVVHGLQDVVL